MKTLFGYVRVSTVKQGEHGVSLQEQRDALLRYAQRNALEITNWFEEKETAAKRGRPVFSQMLKLLKRGKADGVVIHKIDRSARNLKDWADLGELIDHGIEVHFANESLDLHSRGGRLSADIQAVVAADYIRNLREETRKGFYGRLKQGIYPLPAPIGYLDQGAGQRKEIDPVKGPLVRKAFELYASARYNLDDMVEEMYRLGLRNHRGGRVTRTGISNLLNNPFYIGLIRLRRTGELFQGSHEFLISKTLFDRVHHILEGKTNSKSNHYSFLFRRILTCIHCKRSLIGELQKGHTYYRCHTSNCPTTCLREENIDEAFRNALRPLCFTKEEQQYLQQKLEALKQDWATQQEEEIKSLSLILGRLGDRLNRLTDAYIDRAIDRELFEVRKSALLFEKKDLEEKLAYIRDEAASVPDRVAEFLELAGSAYFQYKIALPEEKRDLLKIVTSNRMVKRKQLDILLSIPFRGVAKRSPNSNSTPYRDRPRTLDKMLRKIIDWAKINSLGWMRPEKVSRRR